MFIAEIALHDEDEISIMFGAGGSQVTAFLPADRIRRLLNSKGE